jgi:hypothetical protein
MFKALFFFQRDLFLIFIVYIINWTLFATQELICNEIPSNLTFILKKLDLFLRIFVMRKWWEFFQYSN